MKDVNSIHIKYVDGMTLAEAIDLQKNLVTVRGHNLTGTLPGWVVLYLLKILKCNNNY